MSLNLHHSREWNGKRRTDLSLVQIGTDDSERIYGEGNHQKICDRLEEYYNAMNKRFVEHNAKIKGELHPFTGKDRLYWLEQLSQEQAESKQFIDKLRAIEDLEWSIW